MGYEKKKLYVENENFVSDENWKAEQEAERRFKEAKKQEFEDVFLPKIKSSPKVSFATKYDHFWKIGLKTGQIFDYYPVKNRLHRCKPSLWYYNGLDLLMSMV